MPARSKFSVIILGLGMIHGGIGSLPGQKLFMASLLDHFPFMEDQYLIAKPAGRKSVDDIDRGPVSHDLIEL